MLMDERSIRRTLIKGVGIMLGLVAMVTTSLVTAPPPADAAVTGCGAPRYKSNGQAWRCTFADNFNGTSLNRKNWLPVTTDTSGYHIGNDCYVDRGDNIAVRSGALRLTTRRLSKSFDCATPGGSYRSRYTSASLTSLGKFSQTYGRYEIRAKFPTSRGAGTHSAWWLWPSSTRYGGWPYAGEIDIAEYYSRHADRAIPQIHYVPRKDRGVASRSNYYCRIKNPQTFHTYTLIWTAKRLTIQYDGRTCLDYALKPAVDGLGGLLDAGEPFDEPFTLALTQGVGATDNGPSSRTPFPATMSVDYVRVWK